MVKGWILAVTDRWPDLICSTDAALFVFYTKWHTSDTQDFLHRKNQINRIPEDTISVLFDVVRLCTNTPHDEGINIMKGLFGGSSCYIIFNQKFVWIYNNYLEK